MTDACAPKGMRFLSDFFTMGHADDKGDHLKAVLAHQSLVYVYPGGELQVEFVEQTDAYWLIAELPGLQQDDITVRVDGNRLSVLVEWPETTDVSGSPQINRPHRAFSCQFQLDELVDADSISMTYTDGVLSVCVPKLAASQAELWSHVMVAG